MCDLGQGQNSSDVLDLVSKQQPKSTHFSSQFHQVKFLPTALIMSKIPLKALLHGPYKKSKFSNHVVYGLQTRCYKTRLSINDRLFKLRSKTQS